jgi:hypothetical protein
MEPPKIPPEPNKSLPARSAPSKKSARVLISALLALYWTTAILQATSPDSIRSMNWRESVGNFLAKPGELLIRWLLGTLH